MKKKNTYNLQFSSQRVNSKSELADGIREGVRIATIHRPLRLIDHNQPQFRQYKDRVLYDILIDGLPTHVRFAVQDRQVGLDSVTEALNALTVLRGTRHVGDTELPGVDVRDEERVHQGDQEASLFRIYELEEVAAVRD